MMLERSKQGVVDLLRVSDPLTGEFVDRLGQLFDGCSGDGQPRIVLDLASVPLMDSAALELLLDYQERVQHRGGALKLAGPNTTCRDILHLTGVDRHFEIFPDSVAAVGSFAQ